jgi:protocatechuate 3,4-dioxygenase beta subunit
VKPIWRTTLSDSEGGFRQDMRALSPVRRRLLLLGLGGAAMAGLAFARFAGSGAAQTGTSADGSLCVVPPGETAGPFPGDGTNRLDGAIVNVLTEEGVLRPDLRASFAGRGERAEGVEFTLEITLLAVDGCTPLAGRALYLWHCDAAGRYSLYDLPASNALRGLGVSDGSGRIRFTTIFPGCYDGRWPHLHFEVFGSAEAAVSGRDSLLTAQFALPEDAARAVYLADARYRISLDNLGRQDIARDMVFADNDAAALAAQTLRVGGDPSVAMKGSVTVALA